MVTDDINEEERLVMYACLTAGEEILTEDYVAIKEVYSKGDVNLMLKNLIEIVREAPRTIRLTQKAKDFLKQDALK
jgi:hypothetical protein